MTHRQYLAWREWTVADMNRPSRSDYYAMSIAREVRLVMNPLLKEPRKDQLEDMRIPFKRKVTIPRTPTQPSSQDAPRSPLGTPLTSKSIWAGILGIDLAKEEAKTE